LVPMQGSVMMKAIAPELTQNIGAIPS